MHSFGHAMRVRAPEKEKEGVMLFGDQALVDVGFEVLVAAGADIDLGR